MNKIYWIGGSSCSGKSSCADLISKKHKLLLIKTDNLCFGKYMFENPKIDLYKDIKKYRDMIMSGIDTFAKTDVSVSFDAFIKYCEEVFCLLLQDIEKMSIDKNVIVEGAHILPHLLNNIEDKHHCIFLISSKKQQEELWTKEMNMEIEGGHPGEIESFKNAMNKELVKERRIEFHDRIANYIETKSIENNLKVIKIDNNKTINGLVEIIEENFNLTTAST